MFREMPYTSPPLNTSSVQRVFAYEKKVLASVEKFKSLYKNALEIKERNGVVKYRWKFGFMNNDFWV